MEEAKFSANIKFRHLGFECQFTMRQEEGPAAQVMEMQMQAVKWLWAHGATPNGNGNGHAAAAAPVRPPEQLFPEEPEKPVCPVCGKADELELVHFERDGKPRQALKCQRCKKWLPDKKK
jgi:hypothetical protein